MLKKIVIISGVIAAILVMFAFSVYYVGAKNYADYFTSHHEQVTGLYFMFSCLGLASFSGQLFFYTHDKIIVSSVYLLCSLFFNFLLLFTIFDWIMNDRIRMGGVYFSVMSASLISIIYIFYKALKK